MRLRRLSAVLLALGAIARASPEPDPRPETKAKTESEKRPPLVPPTPPLPLALDDGGAALPSLQIGLSARIKMETQAGPDDPVRTTILIPSWRPAPDGAFVAAAEEPESGARVRLRVARTADGAAELHVDVKYVRATWVGLSALDLALPGPLQVLDGKLAARTVSSVAYLDRLAVKRLRAGDVNLVVEDGVDGVVARHEGAGNHIRVEMFSTEARPFRYQAMCREDWRQDNHEVRLRVRLREAGDRDSARVELRAAETPFVARGRFPDGREAALVITDHADQSGPETFAALARGRSDSATAVGGIEGHHLVITKSLFVRGELNGEGRPQLEDEHVAAVADELSRAGSEIVPHSMTANPDERELTAAGLNRFDRFHSATWIDHQPPTNCEAFTSQGWRGAGDRFAARWRISDLLAAHGYRYIWAGFDEAQLDLLGTERIERRPLTLWPLGRLAPGDPDDRWLFATTWMLLAENEFFHTLGPERLDRLERDHGLAILHTYLESLHGDDNPRFANRNLMRRVHGVVATDPRLEKLFDDLEQRIARGTLWMPTLAGLGDFLRAVERVRVRFAADGTAVAVSPAAVTGLTLQIPGALDVLVDGKPPRGIRREPRSTWFWFDLPAARPVRIELRALPGGASPSLTDLSPWSGPGADARPDASSSTRLAPRPAPTFARARGPSPPRPLLAP